MADDRRAAAAPSPGALVGKLLDDTGDLPRRSQHLLVVSSISAAALVVQLGCRIVSLVLLARALGPAGQGTVSLGILIATLGSGAVGLGIDVALMRAPIGAHGRRDAYASAWTQSFAGIAVAAAVVAVGRAVGVPTEFELGAAAAPGLLISRLGASCALGDGRIAAYAALTILPWVINAGGIAVLVALDELTSTVALVLFASATAASAAASGGVLARMFRPRLALPWKSETYATGIRILPGLLAQLANYRLDQVFIAVFLQRAELGLYTVAVAGSEIGVLPAQAAANAILPRAGRARGSSLPLPRVIGTSVLLATLVIPMFIVAVTVGLPRYDGALVPFLLLFPGVAAAAASKVLAAFVTGRGDAWRASRIAIATLCMTIASTVILIPLAGLAGAAIASSLSYALSALLLYRATRIAQNR